MANNFSISHHSTSFCKKCDYHSVQVAFILATLKTSHYFWILSIQEWDSSPELWIPAGHIMS